MQFVQIEFRKSCNFKVSTIFEKKKKKIDGPETQIKHSLGKMPTKWLI